MDTSNLTLFQMAKTKMDWIAQRQKVLSENIANADTPNYRAKDLREVNFSRMAADAIERPVRPTLTQAGHQTTTLPHAGPFREDTTRKTWETSIDQNPVVLEEQVEKMARGRSQYDLALNLIRKNMSMIKMALGSRG